MRIVLIILVITIFSCRGYEVLNKTKVPYSGNSLRLNGYYYCLGKEFFNGFNKNYTEGFFLFPNGVYLRVLNGSFDTKLNINQILLSFDQIVLDRIKIKNYSNNRIGWGLYSVRDSSIEIENWDHSADGGAYPTRTLKGKVVNDTTIHFHKLIGAHPNNKGGKKKVISINETYHFREFSPKPDSTNVFIK